MIKFSVIFLLSVAACLVLEAGPEPKPAGDLWVDASASGDGDGSTGKPFSTIQQAARVAVAGDTIHVRPGIYRERVMPERGGDPGQPIVYQSEVLHGAVVTGSDVWSPSWRDEGSGIFSAGVDDKLFTDTNYVDGGNPYRIAYNWDQQRKRPPYPFASVSWTLGQVFAEGKTIKETSSRKELAATTQTWWFDPAANRIAVNLGGKNPRDFKMELTTRRGVFRPLKKGLGYIEVRGFVFEHCANQFPGKFWTKPEYAESGMVGTRGGHHWLIESNIIRQAKSIGLAFGTSGGGGTFDNELPAQADPAGQWVGFHHITGNVFDGNGAIGAMGYNHHGVEFSGNLFISNNALLNTSYETGGLKTHAAYDLVVSGNWFVDNDCEGAWLDNTWKNCRIVRNIFLGNRGKNLFFEMDDNRPETESLAADNIFLHRRLQLEPAGTQPPEPWAAKMVGIYGHDASGVRIEHNLFLGDGFGIYFRKMADRKGGAGYVTAIKNMFAGEKLTAVSLPVENPPNVWNNFFDANLYPATRQPFAATGWSFPNSKVDQAGVERILKLATGTGEPPKNFGSPDKPPSGYFLTLAQWQKVMGFDDHSHATDMAWSFDRKNWQLTLTLPEALMTGAAINDCKMKTDFFGRPFSAVDSAGPFAGLHAGTQTIALPRPAENQD